MVKINMENNTIANLLKAYQENNNATRRDDSREFFATYTPDELEIIRAYKALTLHERHTLRDTDPDRYAVIDALFTREGIAKKAAYDLEQKQHLTREYIRHNLKCAIRAAVLDAYAEIIPAFVGKAYGPKTADKISDLFTEATGCRVTLYEYYIAIYPGCDIYGYCNKLDCNIYAAYSDEIKARPDVITPDNKIAFLNVSAFEAGAAPVDDIPGTIEKLLQAYSVAAEKYNALQAAISDYNALQVENIPRLYIRDAIYKDFRF